MGKESSRTWISGNPKVQELFRFTEGLVSGWNATRIASLGQSGGSESAQTVPLFGLDVRLDPITSI